MPPIPYAVSVKDHPGSSSRDIQNELQWAAAHHHRVGYRNNQSRVAGLTHQDDEHEESDEETTEEAEQKFETLRRSAKKGDLLNWRDIMKNEKVGIKISDWC
jgi:nitrate reductase (NAD(P)H)